MGNISDSVYDLNAFIYAFKTGIAEHKDHDEIRLII